MTLFSQHCLMKYFPLVVSLGSLLSADWLDDGYLVRLFAVKNFNNNDRKKTIFDDKPVEIQELTFIIKEDIANLNKQIAQLQTVNLPIVWGADLERLYRRSLLLCVHPFVFLLVQPALFLLQGYIFWPARKILPPSPSKILHCFCGFFCGI